MPAICNTRMFLMNHKAISKQTMNTHRSNAISVLFEAKLSFIRKGGNYDMTKIKPIPARYLSASFHFSMRNLKNASTTSVNNITR